MSTGLGIAALVTASQVGEKQRMGDIQGALAASNRIKKFLMIGLGFLVASLLLSVIILAAADWNVYWTTD
nr:CD225/dispanin family protein [Micromonospora sp. DSM 115978]